jgi:hypothetical protein
MIGCSSIQEVRDNAIKWAESDFKNVATMKEVSDTLKKTWPFYSGILDGMKDQLSGQVAEKKDQLDRLYKSDQWDDRAAGEALILRGRLVYELGQQGMDEVLPGLLKLLEPLL